MTDQDIIKVLTSINGRINQLPVVPREHCAIKIGVMSDIDVIVAEIKKREAAPKEKEEPTCN
jgi:hypothetical protein